MEKINVFALGGLDECGKNMYIIEVGDDIYVVEAGSKYPDKTSPGVDVIIPNYDFLLENKDRIRGVFISHGHLDQLGALAYIYKNHQLDAPIYATSVTMAFIKCHAKDVGIQNDYHFIEVNNEHDYFKIGSHMVKFFQTAHLIAGSYGFALETEQGSIVYTSEFIVEYNNHPKYRLDMNEIARISEKDVLLLMCESRYANRPGYTSPSHRLTPLVQKDFSDAKGRIFFALYDSNLYGLNEVVKLSLDANKKMLFYGKKSQEILETLNSVGELMIPKNNLFTMDDLFRVREQDIVIIILGDRDTLYRQVELLAIGESEDKKLIITPSDTFIVAAPPQIGTEVYAVNAIDEVYKTGAKVINITKKKISSMHAQEEDIKTMLSLLRPKYYMPVIGEFRHILANAKVAVATNQGYSHLNTFVLDNGMVLTFENKKVLPITKSIPTGDLLVDGSGVGDVGDVVLTDRQKLADDGVICMALTVSLKEKRVIAGPDVQMRGFVLVKDSEALLHDLADTFVETVEEQMNVPSGTIELAKQLTLEKATRMVRKSTGKDPMILPLVVEIE